MLRRPELSKNEIVAPKEEEEKKKKRKKKKTKKKRNKKEKNALKVRGTQTIATRVLVGYVIRFFGMFITR
jgi:hypothetical protein